MDLVQPDWCAGVQRPEYTGCATSSIEVDLVDLAPFMGLAGDIVAQLASN